MSPVVFTQSSLCLIPHQGKIILSDIVPLSPNLIFLFLFKDTNFVLRVMETLEYSDINMTEWETNESTGLQTRVNQFVVPVRGFGAKSCHITETQEVKTSVFNEIYVVDIDANNSGVPYGDSFHVTTHVCVTKNSEGDSNVNIYCQVKFTKSVIGFIKRMIEKSVWEGVQTYYATVEEMLRDECVKREGIQSLRRFTTTFENFSRIQAQRRRNARIKIVCIAVAVFLFLVGNLVFWYFMLLR